MALSRRSSWLGARLPIFALGAFLFASPALAAATLHVPSEYPTIGAAVLAAVAGDTILVADGTYSGQGNTFLQISAPITIASVNGAASTIIDLGPTSGYFLSGAGFTLRGFTIENGLFLSPVTTLGDATIEDCVFTHNDNEDFDASAINVNSGTATIKGCTFIQGTGGEAIEFSGSNGNISDCTFQNNDSLFGGGAIYANTATVHVTRSTFDGNTSNNSFGGAAYLLNGTFTFSDCTFTNNSSANGGGALFCAAEGLNTVCAVDHSLFQGNSAPQGGVFFGAFSSGTTQFTAVDSLFIGNTATDDGAVLYLYNNVGIAQSFTNVSFYGNTVTGANAAQGGVLAAAASDPGTAVNLTNAILYSDNTPNAFSQVNPFATITVAASDIAQGTYGTINADPGFIDPLNGDLRILSTSPAAFTGSATGAPADDYLGHAWAGGVSMGAYAPLSATSITVSAPASATSGTAFAVTVTVLDQFGQPFTGYAGAVHFTSSDGAAVLPANATLTNGTGTLNVTLKTAGSQTVTATDTANSSLTGTSGAILVGPGPAVTLQLVAPASAVAGQPVNATVTVFDDAGNPATGYTGTVHFTSSDAQATLPADTTLANGTGTVPVTFKTAGAQTLTATDTASPAIAGATAVTVASGAAATLELVAPATAQAGTAFSVTATVKDAFGNVADGYAGTLHVTSSDGAAALPADQTLTAGTGTLAVTLNTAGPQTVTATDTVTAALTAQASVNVTLRPVADLTIALTHSGSFTRGQTGTYLIDVTNSGTAATTGAITVTDTLPSGLSLTALSGAGWTCDVGTASCSRSDTLAIGATAPQLTAEVAIATNAPSSVTNVATVAGGGETNTANDTASDVTTLVSGESPDLTVAMGHVTPFTVGQTNATYTITVSNAGGAPTAGEVSVVLSPPPEGLTATTLSGEGWTCTLASLRCTRPDVLAAGASYPDLALTLEIAGGSSPVVSTATVSGGGEQNTANDTATDSLELLRATAHGCGCDTSGGSADLALGLLALLGAGLFRARRRAEGEV